MNSSETTGRVLLKAHITEL